MLYPFRDLKDSTTRRYDRTNDKAFLQVRAMQDTRFGPFCCIDRSVIRVHRTGFDLSFDVIRQHDVRRCVVKMSVIASSTSVGR